MCAFIRTQHSTAIGAGCVFRIEELKNESSWEPPYLLSVSIQHVSEWEGEAEPAQPGLLAEGFRGGELAQKAGLALALLLRPVWVGVLQQPPLSFLHIIRGHNQTPPHQRVSMRVTEAAVLLNADQSFIVRLMFHRRKMELWFRISRQH